MVAKFLIVTMLAAVSFTLQRESLIVVPVRLNGQGPYKLLLDTGATHSILSAEAAAQLNLAIGEPNSIITAGGSIPVSMGTVETMEIGAVRISKTAFAITGNELLRNLHVDGIIGGDCLKQFKIFIDYKHKTLSFEP
jgi:predicted aspartyl protease